ncbi:MAG: class I SAM-dependent methyltransferase [Clostridiaceae bacterium]|nr:class I SAM-dependent methyltransferase [Clostridiaceae bacterium]
MQNDSPSYRILAKYYDEFQSDSDIKIIQDEILSNIAQYQILKKKNLQFKNSQQPKNNQQCQNNKQLKIADLGCGTGIFALSLAQQGHIVTAIDLSAPMLKVLKTKKAQLSFPFQNNLRILQADISEYIFSDKQDILLAMTDTLNHLDAQQFVSFFSLADQNLKTNGILIFDLLKLEYLLEERGNRTYFVEFDLAQKGSRNPENAFNVIDTEELTNFNDSIDSNEFFSKLSPAVSMVWENEWLEDEQIAISNLTFFERIVNSDRYLRFTDQVIEYYHDLKNIEQIFCDDFSCVKTLDFPERKLFILQKISDI